MFTWSNYRKKKNKELWRVVPGGRAGLQAQRRHVVVRTDAARVALWGDSRGQMINLPFAVLQPTFSLPEGNAQ